MKLSQLSAEFEKLKWRVDQLVQGVASSEFDERVDQLRAHFKQLAAWAKPRGGGKFEIDIEPYKSVGGAPAFMQEHAGLLLGAATILQNIRVRFASNPRKLLERSATIIPRFMPPQTTLGPQRYDQPLKTVSKK